MSIFDYDSKHGQMLEKAFYLIILGLLWLLLSITVVGFGPASTALYYSVAKSIRRERGRPFQEFGYALKNNWLQSMCVGVPLAILYAFVFLFDFQYISLHIADGETENKAMLIISIIKIFLLLGIGIYIFPIISRFQVSTFRALIVSISLAFRHFTSTIWMAFLLVICVLLGINAPSIGWMISGFYAYLCSFTMEKILYKYVPSDDTEASDYEDKWYMEK